MFGILCGVGSGMQREGGVYGAGCKTDMGFGLRKDAGWVAVCRYGFVSGAVLGDLDLERW